MAGWINEKFAGPFSVRHCARDCARAGLLMVMLALHALPAQAENSREGFLQEQLRQTTLDLRRAQEENRALQGKLAVAEKAVAAQAEADRARSDAQRTREQNAGLALRVTELEQQLQQSAALLQQASEKQAALENAGTAFAQHQAASEQRLAECTAHNAELAGIADDLIRMHRQAGFWDALRQAEPVTGIAKARREALLERYRVSALNATQSSAATPTATQPDTESGTRP